MENDDQTPSGVSRRALLKKGAVVGAAAAWTIPVVQVVSMTAAHADSPSSPVRPPSNPTPIPSHTTTPPTTPTVPTSSAPAPATGSKGVDSNATASSTPVTGSATTGSATTGSATTSSSLAYTGSNPKPILGAGAAAIALGAAAIAGSQYAKNKTEPAADGDSDAS